MKPQNILINKDGRAFVTDVGAAKEFKDTLVAKKRANMTSHGGTVKWMAPEMLQLYLTNKEIPAFLSNLDVFSLGLITLNAIDKDGFTKQKGLLNKDEKVLEKYLQELEAKGVIKDKEFFPILKSMLSFNIDSRISIEKLYYWMVILFFQ